MFVVTVSIIKVGWFVGFYGISTFVGYLMPNPFLVGTIQFSKNTQFKCKNQYSERSTV